MSESMLRFRSALVASRSEIATLEPSEIPAALGELEGARAELWRRLQARSEPESEVSPHPGRRSVPDARADC